MKQLVNRVQLIGNLGKDPELTQTATGKQFLRVSLATNESYKDAKGEFVTNTTWHNLVAWGPLAERMATRLSKGEKVAVAGKLNHRQYDDKNGERKYMTEIVVQDFMDFVSRKDSTGKNEDNLPF
ncbi:MAG: single-stranded DNA-binding protein [Saprospiraceae bacterium]|nr:single-stranded DNA-binding protein [Saprospiraceae bacterium]